MQRVVCGCMLVLLLLAQRPAEGQIPVTDGAAAGQRLAIWIEEEFKWAQSLANQVKEIEATYNVIVQQVKQYETMVQNLKRLPEGWDLIQAITGWSTQLAGLLSTARMLGYNLSTVQGQFGTLYLQVGALGTAGDVLVLRHKLLDGRMEAAQMAATITAQQETLGQLATRMCSLLNAAETANGNLDMLQINALQNGLLQQTLEAQLAVQATHARQDAQQQAEDGALERVRMQAIQGAMGNAEPLGEPQGALPKFHW